MLELILISLVILGTFIFVGKIVFGHDFDFFEMSIQFSLTAVFLIVISLISNISATSDTQLLNGKVVNKNVIKRDCGNYSWWSDWPDSFCTNEYTRQVRDGETCSTDSKGNKSCTPRYKTQYKSKYEWEQKYFVYSTLMNYTISRVDERGLNTPDRYKEVEINDPATISTTYTNYIKAASSTLFNQKFDNDLKLEYPTVYDYYKVNRVLTHNYLMDTKSLNEKLSVLNSKIAGNVIIVLTGDNEIFAENLAQHWEAHNINDIVISIGMKQEKIDWVSSKSWSENELVNITIRDELLNLGILDEDKIIDVIGKSINSFYKEKSMEEFEYLKDDIPIPTWVYVLYSIILLIVTPIVMIYFSKNDFTNH